MIVHIHEISHRRRATVETPNSRGRNLTLIMAMSEDGVLGHHLQFQSVNTARFCSFLGELCNALEKPSYIVMDNASFHRSDEVKNVIETHGHQRLFLPPYSPFLNPIENLFNLIKVSHPFRIRNKKACSIPESITILQMSASRSS